LGKHSGRHAFRSRLSELGYSLGDDELNRAFLRFKDLADKKKEVSNADIESIVNDETQLVSHERYKMVHIQVLCGDQQIPTATSCVRDEELDQEFVHASVGTGPVDAAIKAVRGALKVDETIKLLEYTVSSVTAGVVLNNSAILPHLVLMNLKVWMLLVKLP
jgi:2-isopropylmalate synthase